MLIIASDQIKDSSIQSIIFIGKINSLKSQFIPNNTPPFPSRIFYLIWTKQFAQSPAERRPMRCI